MDKKLSEACEAFAERLALADSRARARAYAIRKGKTLLTLSSEARELRRIDRVLAEAPRCSL
ncbi:MAG: hypothetical protein WC344_05285 [Bacilli bacterium]|jgi:hypothetical protein